MKAESVIAVVLVAGVLYLAWHLAMWAQRTVEVLPL